ncbi:MAG: hypothetical protein AAF990_13275 [Bacteroidota bacterium]
MNFSTTEAWLRSSILHKGYLSLEAYPKGKKIYDWHIHSGETGRKTAERQNFEAILSKAIKIIQRKSAFSVQWFKLNVIDNAVTQLVGMGEINNAYGLDLVSALLIHDTADQCGDTIVGLFDSEKDWILKATNNQDNSRIHLKFYGDEFLKEKIEASIRHLKI